MDIPLYKRNILYSHLSRGEKENGKWKTDIQTHIQMYTVTEDKGSINCEDLTSQKSFSCKLFSDVQSLCLCYMCYMCCTHMYAHVGAVKFTSEDTCKGERLKMLAVFSTIFFETESFTESGTPPHFFFFLLDQLTRTRGICSSLWPPVPRLQALTAMFNCQMGAGDPNSGPHACTEHFTCQAISHSSVQYCQHQFKTLNNSLNKDM